MRNRGELVIGSILLLLGLIFLIGTVFRINLWGICWPTALIAVGVLLVLRPRMVGPEKNVNIVLFGDLERRGGWNVRDEEIWTGFADIDLDLLTANLPAGETRLSIYGFVGATKIYIPESIGVAVQANGFILDTEIFGQDRDSFVSPIEVISENYASAERRLKIEIINFIGDLKVKRV